MEDALLNIVITFGIFMGLMGILISVTWFIKLLHEISMLKSQEYAYDLMSKDESINIKLADLELKQKQAEVRRGNYGIKSNG